jgi:3-oxoacyl-[acyl-carrier protein] reductase
MFDLTGKTALVTGATGGLGSAIARAFHAQGANVVLSGTRENVLQDLALELGERTFAVAANLSDPAAVDGLVDAAETAAGNPLDILVANAGITKDGLLMRMKDEDWDAVIRVNLESYFRLSRAATKGMMRRRYGRIIGITSIVGVMGNPGQANYAASKAGMLGLTKTLAKEAAFILKRNGKLDDDSIGITVNTVTPGYVATEMVEKIPEKVLSRITAQIPVNRLCRPEEIARVVHFLAADASAYITGQVWGVNGGLDM